MGGAEIMSEHAVSKFYKTKHSKKESVKPSKEAEHSRETKHTSHNQKTSGQRIVVHGLKREAFADSVSAPKRKKCHLNPEPLWRVFPRQQMAFEFSRKCVQNSAVFAEEHGKQGQRKYVVTTYYEFGQRYLSMKESRHYYEVVGEDCACRLYFDIEFKKDLNPNADGITLLQTFIQYICYQLYVRYGLDCDRVGILDLESSTSTKFSRHLIFHLPGAAFKNNIHAGHFVHHCCDQLKSFKSHADSAADRQVEYDHHFPPPVVNKRGKDVPQCPPALKVHSLTNCLHAALDLMSLFVLNDKQKQVLICDEGVYTRNRNFRLYLSSKLGKDVPLLLSKENRFKSSYGEDSTRRRRSQKFNTLMDCLICNVSFETCSRVLEFTPPHKPSKKKASAAASSSEAEAGYQHSPFPMVDTFITSTLTMGGTQGSIRRWTYFSQGKQIVYDILHNRWCENIGRPHKSNNIMVVADLMRGVFYQKCHDPECKRANYRSSEKPLPVECNPVSTQPAPDDESSEELSLLTGGITAEEIRQLEADTSYDTPPHGKSCSDSSGSIDELMLEALTDYESTVKAESTSHTRASQAAFTESDRQGGGQPDYNMSVEELDSFCEDIDDN